MTERRLKPPVVHIPFNPGAHNFTRGDIKKSFDSAERLDRSVLIAAAVRPSRIIFPNSRHDLLLVAKFDLLRELAAADGYLSNMLGLAAFCTRLELATKVG
jgi:hypothetical protein